MMRYINTGEFDSEVLNQRGVVIVDFYATWCGPCKMLTPVLESIDNEMENIKVVKVDIDESRRLAMNYGIQSVPTIKIFKDGREVVTRVGFQPKETLENIIQMIM
ncbi:thioredoxin [Clostridium paraputrificum]|uniref:Thioredoxin n=1 Tax=Clostridium paraputrificum TaxID=29363 RepID=A0A1B8RP02_9CLOT|nr:MULTISPECIES: thioredoxin [Clostridium]MBS6887786.1 thioredoxin [Clostridium sp.]MDB2070924.1 thioredoxin [Clostridium paraputrificum]MDB2082119.1 thioredoxin [Clostridium paraputrificum]MDB2088152.1 thioredoxin [Clostridium paraputrificum]MDB2094902.1 thioredoxin [Clostridium paraputrificum]